MVFYFNKKNHYLALIVAKNRVFLYRKTYSYLVLHWQSSTTNNLTLLNLCGAQTSENYYSRRWRSGR